MFYLDDINKNNNLYIKNALNTIITEKQINCSIISTEPLYHKIYCDIALTHRLSILLDKPITLEKDMVTISEKSETLVNDYVELCDMFTKNTFLHS